MAYSKPAVACLAMHSYSVVEHVDSDSALVDRLVVAVVVYIAAVVLVAEEV